ncbi:MAG: peptidylprolyl isomerase [Eggerthellaceae bacterium]|nr:peptidylprolyl isomerase [Eggerthellaceae bacterium]
MLKHVPSYVPTGEEIALLHTAKGDITALLRGADAPVNTGQFIELAHGGFYDHLNFFKVEPGRYVKGGCPSTRFLTPAAVAYLAPRITAGIGGGNCGTYVDPEVDAPGGNLHDTGALVLTGGLRMSLVSCQFYFCLGPMHDQDRVDTVIGEVVEGMDVVRALAPGDEIFSVEILGYVEPGEGGEADAAAGAEEAAEQDAAAGAAEPVE